MQSSDLPYMFVVGSLLFASVFILVRWGHVPIGIYLKREEDRYDKVLNGQLLLHVPPKAALLAAAALVACCALIPALLIDGFLPPLAGGLAGLFLPALLTRHLIARRKARLERQLVDGITALASGVRAGLTLVQSIELLVKNTAGPIQQEFAQLLREYNMGLDLSQAMRNAANRIALSNYRLLFTAIEMHRLRGGDTGESLDRIAEAIREIQRLEGKLDAVTAQGRAQARFMAVMPLVVIGIYYLIDPEGVSLLFHESYGRLILLIAAALIVTGFVWIRRIMAVDI
jgi:tight adherence protein B